MYLNKALRDKWGLPTVTFDAGWKTNELNMRKDMMSAAAEMLEAAGLKNVTPFDDVTGSAPGNCIHEMGTARMGRDPEDVGAERLEPGAHHAERVRHRRLVHGVRIVRESFLDLHGPDGPRV